MSYIPNEEDWGTRGSDLDRRSAYESFFGKSNEQMQTYFYRNGSELISEIRFMPPRPFRYYILGVRDFILADNFPRYEAADFCSYFLDMVEYLLKNETSLVSSSMLALMPTLEYIANNQDKYEAPYDIYGDFSKNLVRIKALCEKHSVKTS